MYRHKRFSGPQNRSLMLFCLCWCLFLLCGCGQQATISTTPLATTRPALKQILVLPNVGIQDLDNLDPTQGGDQNTDQALTMIYSGLLRLDQNLNVIPDQATWSTSADNKVYTFYLKPGLSFSDGTPVTAQTYVYTLTRALLPSVQANDATLYLGAILGASDVLAGKSTTLSGVKALNTSTLEITLTQPTAYFLQSLTNPIAFPVNQQVVEQYGEDKWADYVAGHAVGTGPFVVKEWEHNTKMVLTPNPHYYGQQTRLTEVDMIFVTDAHTAFQAYQGGQYSLVWNLNSADFAAAHGLAGYVNQSLLQTDAFFFNTQMPPFDQPAVRQAFAYALDRNTLIQSVLNNSVVPALSIVPMGLPDYQPALTAMSLDPAKALSTLQSVYPDLSQMPQVTFSYPTSLVSSAFALSLQQMWQATLHIQVKLLPAETNAYNIAVAHHQIQFGFEQWSMNLADPYDALAVNLLSNAPANQEQWSNSQFDQLIQQAEQASGIERSQLYGQAEQVAINDVGLLPLDHQTMSAVIPPTVHGVSLNHLGLYFGDWSDVYLLPR